MQLMSRYKDNHFDLAIVDPPYGIGISGQKEVKKKRVQRKRSGAQNRKYHKEKKWDYEIPTKEYFTELKRVSKNQIIWGANYFVEHLTKGTKGWIVWDKQQKGLWSSDGEIAYTSFNVPTRIFLQNRIILQQEGGTIHPTQKPVKLYEWLLTNYAKEGDKILDTHLGSGSIAIACHNLKYDLTACELDKDYFEAAMKRLKQHQAQKRLF
jgi:site-specific DNA-methyltransferase (adenine-specific)